MFQYLPTVLTIYLLVLVVLDLGLLTFPSPFLAPLETGSPLDPGVGERRSRSSNVDFSLACSSSACLLVIQLCSASSVGELPYWWLLAVDVAVAVAWDRLILSEWLLTGF